MNILNLVRENIKNMKPYSSARNEFSGFKENMIFLDANENPFENNGLNRYPNPQQKSIKNMLAFQKGISTKNILLGNGSNEVLDLIFRAFCEPKRNNIIILPPTYGMYKVLANINEINVIEVELSTGFQLRVNTILSAVNEQSKLLFLCSPNNPTGNSFSVNNVENILINFKGIVIIDEAYIDFSEKESWLHRLKKFPNLIITQTFSKAYGMAGIRLGICYASEQIISILNKIKPPYNINKLTQKKAIYQLEKSTLISAQIQQIRKERELLIVELRKISFVKKIYPSDANFLLLKVDDATKRYYQLIKKGIVIRNRTNEILCNNCLRITVGKPEENQQLIKILKLL